MSDIKLWLLYSNTWGHLEICWQKFEQYLKPFNYAQKNELKLV